MEINFYKEHYTRKKKNNENYIDKSEYIKHNIILNNNSKSLLNKNDNTKYNFFNVIHSINKKINKDNTVYQSKDFKDIKKTKLRNHSRSSNYRGVSKNGNKWQVFMMINKKNKYFGSYDSEEIAAYIYDIASIKKNGLKAITNFKYNSNQIDEIVTNFSY